MKNQKGITLIALVITIIVLLILAGVSIAMLMGDNGILSQATKSGDETKMAEQREQVALVINELTSSYYEEKYVKGSTGLDELGEYVGSRLKAKLSDYAKVQKETDTNNYKIETIATDKDGKVSTATFDVSNSKLSNWTPETATITE